jgi:glycosyltransferase involved in cell wall biosynthesis
MLSISVVIPSLNSLLIGDVLTAVRGQATALSGTVEVVVVGRDERELVWEDEVIRFVDTGRPVPPAIARNVGMGRARGRVICFLDADCVPHRLWLQRLLDRYETPDVTVVGGGVAFPTDKYWRLADNISTFYPYLRTSPPGTRDQLPSLNLSFRREVWEEVGPFDERYPRPAGEDADWTTRARLAGHQLHFEPRAVVTHYPTRTTFGDLWRHAVGFGTYSIKVDKRYRAALRSPLVFKHWVFPVLAAPAMAAWVTGRVFSDRHLWRYFYTLPAVYVAKLGWCWGASKRLRGRVEWYRPGEAVGRARGTDR